jgi:hypothetical protein
MNKISLVVGTSQKKMSGRAARTMMTKKVLPSAAYVLRCRFLGYQS